MSWIALSLCSAFLFGAVTVMDRLMVSRYFNDGFIYSLFIRGFALISAALVAVAAGRLAVLPYPSMIWALASGVVQIAAWGFYFKAIVQSDAAWVAAFVQSKPIVTALLGWLVLGELLGPAQYIGITAMMVAATLLSVNRGGPGEPRWRWNHSVGLMIFYVVASGLNYLFARIGLEGQDPNNVFFWQQVGATGGAMVLLAGWPTGRRRLAAMLRPITASIYLISFLVELVVAVAGFLTIAALAIGPLGPVTALASVTPLFVPPVTRLVHLVRPGIAPTDNQRTILPWWASVLIIALGVYLVNTGR
jgi:drug/metabolite transporter (DMT)-like permease